MKNLLKKDIPAWVYYLLGVIFIGGKLALAACQTVYIWTEGAPLDDGFMYNAAVSITQGNWLGAYNWLTLSKHAFFAVWLAFLHLLGIPYLIGGQLLWAGACATAVAAFSPVIAKRWQRFVMFAVLLFSPAATAAFTLRVYRDNIFPALCVIVFAGFIGTALRLDKPLKKSLGFLIGGGFALGAAYLSREDGVWVLPFVLAATAITVIFIIFKKGLLHKVRRALCLAVPYVLAVGCILVYCGINNAYYGRFIVSDFTSTEFNDVIGAMARVEQTDWNPKASIPYETRRQLYDNVPEFAMFEELLESKAVRNGYYSSAVGDYSSGAFYWALRRVAQELGVYDTPQKAQEYWANLAQQINAACDNGTIKAGKFTSSTMPPLRSEYILPVTQEAFHSLRYTLTFQDTLCYYPNDLSVGKPKDIKEWETFLKETSNIAAVENSADVYYHPLWLKAYALMNAIRWLYIVGVPLGFLAAFVLQCRRGWQLLRAKQQHRPTQGFLLWLVLLGILLMALLRCFIVAYVTVASFTIGTYVMYLSTVHPLLLLYMLAGLMGRSPAPDFLPAKE